ncbi:MAG: winged helix-turn-helix transcriptional regulator [Ruminococcaceae bacterium]|nr:winged helix-turn-helix transcriptional regulator [Oscillospiraceae bacterium]
MSTIKTEISINEIPPHVEYSFTEKGRDFMPVFYEMMNWGFKYEADNENIIQE